MPEMHFVVRWPDDSVSRCYSPSLVVRDFLQPGCSYALEDFLGRSRAALGIASERVRQKYGFGCAHAAAELERIEALGKRFAHRPDARVIVQGFEE